jgi:pilus assembly protein CpaD
MKINKLTILFCTLIGGCTPEVAEWTPAQSPKEITVDRAIFTYAIDYPVHASSLSEREKRNFLKFLRTTVGSPLAVSVILEEYGGHSEKRIKDIIRELIRFGIPYSLITEEYEQEEHSQKCHGRESGSGVLITIERYVAIPPSCGDFSQPIGDAQQAYAHSNHGCADTANLALMLANPRDAIKGRTLGDSDGTVIAAGIDRYRKDKTKALIDTSTNVSPGTTSTSSATSSTTGGVGGVGGGGY